MTLFYDLPFFPRSMFGLWTFLLCAAGIAGIILAFAFKRYRYAILSLVSFASSYFLWQVIFNLYRFGISKETAPVSLWLGRLPWLIWLAGCFLLTFVAVFPIYLLRRQSRTTITPFAIKYCGDRMNCGVCFWRDNGRVTFSNDCMNRLCMALTGEQLLNGNSFSKQVAGGLQHVGDEVWRFTLREMEFDGSPLHEMVAWDVTEIHAKTEALQKDNEELSHMTEEMKAYNLKIDDVVRRQEILQAKVNIHAEMNHLMLSTVAADREDTEALNRIFMQWQKNALLLCKETEENAERFTIEKLEQFAQLLGAKIRWNGRIPERLNERQRDLFFSAAQEAIVNAVKHGEAKLIDISFEDAENQVTCIFENDGNIQAGDVLFTGGLANLSLLAKEQNAEVLAKAGALFRLELKFTVND